MKYIVIFLFLTQSIIAQTSGTITYERVFKFVVTDDMPAALKNMQIPDQKGFFQLVYTAEASLYQNVIPEETNNNTSGVVFRQNNADYRYHIDRINKKTTEQKEFLGKKFLIKGDWEKPKWKVSGESKVILGYPCIKANLVDTSRQVVAWFAIDLKTPLGPEEFGFLPGMILEMTLGNALTYRATKVSSEEPAPFEPPTKGKKVTAEKYEKIQKEKLEELKAERKTGGSSIFTIGG